MAITQSDHNNIVSRASQIVWLGIFTFIAVLLYLVVVILFFPLSGTNFALSIVDMVASFALAVFAIWFATPSLLATNIFRFAAIVVAVITFIIFVVQFVFFIQALINDSSGNTAVTSILLDILQQTFIFLVSALFFGLALSEYVVASHYAAALERKAVIDSEEPNDDNSIVTVTSTIGGDVEVTKKEIPNVTSITATAAKQRRRSDRLMRNGAKFDE